MKREKILNLAKKGGYDNVKRLGMWEGYEVWEPGYDGEDPYWDGIPQFILVFKDLLRFTDGYEESMSIMQALW